jgi:hypothetical protein
MNYSLTEEVLLLQKRAGIITETEYRLKLAEVDIALDDKEQAVVDDIKDEMSSILKSLETEFDKASKEEPTQKEGEPTNEGLLTAASIVIALPAIMGIIARLGKTIGNTVNKILGKKPTEDSAYQQWMAKLGHIADELHHLYLVPIKGIVKKFIKDPAKADKVSDAIFHIIVAIFLVASGATAIKALQAKNLSLATLESALAAVKSGELTAFITKLIG